MAVAIKKRPAPQSQKPKISLSEYMEIGGRDGIATKTDIVKIETKIGDLKSEITAVNGKIDSVKNELKGEIKEVKGEIKAVKNELNNKIDGVKNELKGQIQLLILLNVGIFLAVVGSIIASFLKT